VLVAQIFPSSEAWLGANKLIAAESTSVAALLGHVKSCDVTVFGDVTAEVQAALDAWSTLPQVNITTRQVTCSSFCSPELATSPQQFGYVAFMKFKTPQGLDKCMEVCGQPDVVALKKQTDQASFIVPMDDVTFMSFELYASERNFQQFNEGAFRIPYMADAGPEGFAGSAESAESFAFGTETDALRTALDAWNQVPHFNVQLYPERLKKRPSFGACRADSVAEVNEARFGARRSFFRFFGRFFGAP